MKKKLLHCYIVTLLIIFYLFLGWLKPALATGTYTCKWQFGSCIVDNANTNCSAGERAECSGFSRPQCIARQNLACIATATPTPGAGGVRTHPCTTGYTGECLDTALGEIPVEPAALVSWVLKWSVSIGGGIAFLLMVWGGFKILTSSGNPEALNQGKEIISSAIAGLLLIIFSLILLRVIGYDILGIPGFITP